MTKRITITAGDYVPLSDIPNEQVFNLVKECFINAGYDSVSVWEGRTDWTAFYANSDEYCRTYSCFVFESGAECYRQLSLSDVFNSTNGNFDWGSSDVALILTNWTDATRTTRNYITIERIVEQPMKSYETPDTYKISKCFDIGDLQNIGIKHVQGRASGKSKAHHLELISKAMKSPEQWVKVYSDYFDSPLYNTRVMEEVRDLCHKLNLDWMEFDNNNQRIRYMPYQTVKMVSKWERVE